MVYNLRLTKERVKARVGSASPTYSPSPPLSPSSSKTCDPFPTAARKKTRRGQKRQSKSASPVTSITANHSPPHFNSSPVTPTSASNTTTSRSGDLDSGVDRLSAASRRSEPPSYFMVFGTSGKLFHEPSVSDSGSDMSVEPPRYPCCGRVLFYDLRMVQETWDGSVENFVASLDLGGVQIVDFDFYGTDREYYHLLNVNINSKMVFDRPYGRKSARVRSASPPPSSPPSSSATTSPTSPQGRERSPVRYFVEKRDCPKNPHVVRKQTAKESLLHKTRQGQIKPTKRPLKPTAKWSAAPANVSPQQHENRDTPDDRAARRDQAGHRVSYTRRAKATSMWVDSQRLRKRSSPPAYCDVFELQPEEMDVDCRSVSDTESDFSVLPPPKVHKGQVVFYDMRVVEDTWDEDVPRFVASLGLDDVIEYHFDLALMGIYIYF
ncbi:hypothetical protein HDU76_005046 [Blyttiomyces sp. JEL0837]|nr:hypothetical protein HDU76_005046 [Blyttiomyces sp. JEL0837]